MDNVNPKAPPSKPKTKKHKNKTKPKITKEERRAKYTAIARDRREKLINRHRQKDIICYKCRKKGHSADNCTADAISNNTVSNTTQKHKGGVICYKCGSTEHRIQQCVKIQPFLKGNNSTKIDFTKIGELPYANCYICNESGHLSSGCPKNTKGGVFPDGGVCRECGEAGHFAKDCMNKKKKKSDDGSVSENSVTIEQYLEDDDGEEKAVKKTPKKKMVVNF